jgi:hypothetical protein
MTHDELLEEIDDRFSDTCDAHCESCSTKNFPIKALRAVVELHKPIQYPTSTNLGDECGICRQEPYYSANEPYPCSTIQAIEKELV